MPFGQELIHDFKLLRETQHLGLRTLSSYPAHAPKIVHVHNVAATVPTTIVEHTEPLRNHVEIQLGIFPIGFQVLHQSIFYIRGNPVSPHGITTASLSGALGTGCIGSTGQNSGKVHSGDRSAELGNGGGNLNSRHN